MIPDEVLVSAAAGSTRTRSAKGLILILLMIDFLFCKRIFRNHAIQNDHDNLC
jgi:hypothetical protein